MSMSVKQAVLTIDDSLTEHFLRKCDYLQRHDIPAVFFCIGRQLEAMPDMVIKAIKGGLLGRTGDRLAFFSRSSDPDLEIELLFTGAKKCRFAVECKWRSEFREGRIDTL